MAPASVSNRLYLVRANLVADRIVRQACPAMSAEDWYALALREADGDATLAAYALYLVIRTIADMKLVLQDFGRVHGNHRE